MWGRRALKHTGIPGACVSFSVKGDAGATHSHCPYLRRSLLQCIMYVCLYCMWAGPAVTLLPIPPGGTYARKHPLSLHGYSDSCCSVANLTWPLTFLRPATFAVPCVYGSGGGGGGQETKLKRLAIHIHSFVIFTNKFDFGNVWVSLLFLLFCAGWVHASLYG